MLSKGLTSDCPSKPSLFVGVILLLFCIVLLFFSSFCWCGWCDWYVMISIHGHFLISVNMLNNLNINWFSSLSGLSLISPNNWYSGGHAFDPRSGHISFVEIWSLDNF